jgi:hypothetical protein
MLRVVRATGEVIASTVLAVAGAGGAAKGMPR